MSVILFAMLLKLHICPTNLNEILYIHYTGFKESPGLISLPHAGLGADKLHF